VVGATWIIKLYIVPRDVESKNKHKTLFFPRGNVFFFVSNATTCHCGLRGPPSWAWHGRSVTDFWGWDAHEAHLRCNDDVSVGIEGCSAKRALKPKFYQPNQTMVTAGILPFRENSHGRAGNRARNLMISSQRLWPLDHEAGPGWTLKILNG